MNVFLTVDTEIWPYVRGWPVNALPTGKTDFSEEVDAYIFGKTSRGEFGLPFQMDVLDRHGLKAVYFVEALFASKVGLETLARIVSLIRDRGHEVQLHLHTEWLREISRPDLPAQFRQHIRQFPRDEQARIIAHGIANLRAAGARNVCAFRAGNFGANFDTLRALAHNGIIFDTSHNTCFLDAECQMRTAEPLLQHRMIDGVYEFPVTVFNDYPGHVRPAQLCACSFQELEAALLQAWRAGWYSFVIVWHGFELLRHVRKPGRQTPDRIIIRRFERLCGFLAANRDKFHTAVFSEIDARAIPQAGTAHPLKSRLRYSAWRFVEQIASRLI